MNKVVVDVELMDNVNSWNVLATWNKYMQFEKCDQAITEDTKNKFGLSGWYGFMPKKAKFCWTTTRTLTCIVINCNGR